MKHDIKQMQIFMGEKIGQGTVAGAALLTVGVFIMFASLIFVFHEMWKVVLIIAVIGLGIAAVGAGVYTAAQKWRRRKTKWIVELEGTDALQQLVQDFQGAESRLYGSVRLGNEQLYAENFPRPIPYAEIDRAYQRIGGSALLGEDQSVWVVLNDEEKTAVQLGDAPTLDKANDEVKELLDQLLKKNPDIRIGEQ
ncbi:MAG: hypothetical protein IJ112_04845 [Oscillospiraceae bacterium]|nr:hypothetical protein [Oscillospiraceae bacterium]